MPLNFEHAIDKIGGKKHQKKPKRKRAERNQNKQKRALDYIFKTATIYSLDLSAL